jgi:predicted DNA-binding transcriptional regulator YafY
LSTDVASRTSRLLALLELLQDRGHATGGELAAQLGIDRRTLRRDIAALQALGIPVEGQRGVGGGYRIRPGYRLPPLMLKEDEVVAVALGLLAARASQLPASLDAVEGALAKIHRVLPPTLRRQVAALEATVFFIAAADIEPVRGDTALQLAEAIRRSRRLSMRYTSHDGTPSRRRLSPYGLVVHWGRVYLSAHDHTREALRTFRVDRITDVRIDARAAARPAPSDYHPVSHIRDSLASVPWTHKVSVRLDLPVGIARSRLPDLLGVLTPADGGVRLDARVESLDWIARVLAGLGCRFTIERPAELRTTVTALARSLQESARD